MTVSSAFYVVAIELDSGPLFLAERAAILGCDRVLAAVLNLGAIAAEGCSVEIEAQALPPETVGAWWSNREAAVLLVQPGAGSVYDGEIVFDGVIAAEPGFEAGVFSLQIIPPRRRTVNIPDLGIITADAWPLAADSAMGQVKPLIFGNVEDCPLLPVRLPPATRLAADALPGDGQLDVDDTGRFAESGEVMVDGYRYAYEAKSALGNTLLGMSITGAHRQGTAVVQSGDTIFLAAGHPVSAIADLRANGSQLAGGSVNPDSATVTFNAPPLLVERGERFSLTAQFDQVSSGTTALNAINAIRAVTDTVNQSAVSLPGAVNAATQNAGIIFARPPGRIVKGVYSVAFTVVIGAQVGWARVKIGSEVVWMMEPPASVLYDWSPATLLLDDDTDILPVVVEVAEGGSADQVSVTITGAARLVSLGNLDDANFATLRSPSNLVWRADQTDALPNRGPIAKARLWVRWFVSGDTVLPAAAVKFAGRTLGTLAQTQLSGATLSQTVSVDVIAQGAAALPQQAISTVVSGGTASLSHNSIPQTITLPAAMSYPFVVGGVAIQRGFSRVPVLTGWTSALGNIICKLQVQCDSGTPTDVLKWVDIRRANGSAIAQITAGAASWTNVASYVYETSVSISEAPDHLYWTDASVGNGLSLLSLSLSYNAKTTSTAVSQSNTAASGYSNPLSAQSLAHNGISLRTNNGAISLTVPAPPRVVDTLFDLSWVRDWADLTGQSEIAYTAGGPDLCVNQVSLLVDYDAQVFSRVESLTGSVAGLSGNPADVIALLAGKTGQRTDPAAVNRLRGWCAGHDYVYAHRVAESIDSLQVLTWALGQVNAIGCQGPDGLAPVRRLDFGRAVRTIHDADLLAPARITWAEAIENAITLRYRADYSGNLAARRAGSESGDFSRVRLADASNNGYCRRSQAQIRETRPVTVEAVLIRDDATAARCLAEIARLNARPRRVLELPCSFATEAREGDLIHYRPRASAADQALFARVIAINLDGRWPTLTAEQIND